ncbi:hypothetical protein Dsin_006675 [Dipteronia sinensis]|uniref:Uncharacterized protein n=1 Tax=Dipteronia sinensis TaxID=43782 RepID=A0AAE0AYT7_9ROSI|nr:hypothetical protein Dsin_006675 [Dipteronia sinensis]
MDTTLIRGRTLENWELHNLTTREISFGFWTGCNLVDEMILDWNMNSRVSLLEVSTANAHLPRPPLLAFWPAHPAATITQLVPFNSSSMQHNTSSSIGHIKKANRRAKKNNYNNEMINKTYEIIES